MFDSLIICVFLVFSCIWFLLIFATCYFYLCYIDVFLATKRSGLRLLWLVLFDAFMRCTFTSIYTFKSFWAFIL